MNTSITAKMSIKKLELPPAPSTKIVKCNQPPSYESLSYIWGANFECGDGTLKTTANLHKVPRRVRFAYMK